VSDPTIPVFPGGLGREAFGDPMGGGGPLTVVRAWAISGQVVRVVFSELPVFRSPAGLHDALNSANYLFSVDAGQATSPEATVVADDLVVGPAKFVGNGAGASAERGVDVHVDRALIHGVTYRVTVRAVEAAEGGELGAPTSAAFPGSARLRVAMTPGGRMLDLVDFRNDVVSGSWRADAGGDMALQDADSGYRKRVLRRALTPLDSYSFLRGYGTKLRLKELASQAQVAAYRIDLENQIKREPDTDQVAVGMALTGANVLTVTISARRKQGGLVTAVLVGPDVDGSFRVTG
jgi:hypothetical protein